MFGDSQTLSMGFGSQTQSMSSPQKKVRQDEKHICMPLLVKSVLSAAESTDRGGDFRVFGEEPSMMLLVGVAESVVCQAASVEFVLNDSTGRLKVRQYLTDSSTSTNISNGQYVTVVGAMRLAPEMHVSAQFVSVVESPDEVSFHAIEALHTMLKLTKGKAKDEPMTPATKRPVTTSFANFASHPDVVADTPQKDIKVAAPVSGQSGMKSDGQALGSALTSLLQQQSASNPEGMKIVDIVKQMIPSAEVDVRACLEKLVSDGEVFNTIDDDHFSTV